MEEKKKLIDVLMEDDKWIERAEKEKKEKEKIEIEKEKAKIQVKGGYGHISEVDRSILKAIIFETKEPKAISRLIGYPEIIVKKALERLVAKGYLNYELEPTEKIKEIRLKPKSKRDSKLLAVDVAIVTTALALLFSLLYYLGMLS
jgi:hypothetical protein